MLRTMWLLGALVWLVGLYNIVSATPSRAYKTKHKQQAFAGPATIDNVFGRYSAKSLVEEHSNRSSGRRQAGNGAQSGGKREEVAQGKVIVNIKSCIGNFCDPGWEPYPNIVSAMTGYNILKGNAYNFGTEQDPGFENGYIFVPVVKDDDDRYALHGGITVRAISKCDLTMKTKTVSTVKGYQNLNRGTDGSFEGWKTNPPVEISVEAKGVTAKVENPPLFQSYGSANNAQKENEEFFTKMQGVLTISDATCALYSMQISRRYPPPFQQPFKNAVIALSKVRSNTEQRKKEFYRFIKDFGTHYLEKATIGARLSLLRRYHRNVFQEASSEEIERCSKGRLAYWFVKEEGSYNCTAFENANNLKIFNEMQREYIVSYGSKPEASLTDWANQDFEYPVPIKMTLVPIIDLFDDDFMKQDNDLKDIDTNAMLEWMEPLYENYCENMKTQLGIKLCNPGDMKRCGYNDDCNAAFEDCVQTSEKNFECRTKINKDAIKRKLEEVMGKITTGMNADAVAELIGESSIGKLHGAETYMLVMNEDYGRLGVAGDNAVMVTAKSFKAAVAWANSYEVGEGTKSFKSDVKAALGNKACDPFDAKKAESMNEIINAINNKGHSVKFMIQGVDEVPTNVDKMAAGAMQADFTKHGQCGKKDHTILIGPGSKV